MKENSRMFVLKELKRELRNEKNEMTHAQIPEQDPQQQAPHPAQVLEHVISTTLVINMAVQCGFPQDGDNSEDLEQPLSCMLPFCT